MRLNGAIWKFIDNIQTNANMRRVRKYGKEKVEKVYYFCTTAQVLRSPENCAQYLGVGYDTDMCKDIIKYLFDTKKMGAYCFGKGEPQPIMREYIRKKINEINTQSKIMEVGPGNLPLFMESDYPNWYSCDINYDNDVINFNGKIWGKGKYSKIFRGGWENLSNVCADNKIGFDFDLVCGSHSFEHNQKPVTALKEAASILRSGGYIVIFVPDGYSTWDGNYDKTHSMYLTNEMVEDLFNAAGGFDIINCEQFRKNMDLAVIARKE